MRTLILLLLLYVATPANACTAFFVEGSPNAVVAKNLDWFTGQGLIYINKRNVKKTSIFVHGQTPLTWVAKYVSGTLTQSGIDFPYDGMNEAGFAVTGLQLLTTVVPPADARPAVDYLQFMQYLLDTSASTAEAIANAQKVRIGDNSKIHYFACDRSGQCATLEYIDGALSVHSEAALPAKALANNSYADSITYFNQQTSTLSPLAILSNISHFSLDRFTRAGLWSKNFGTTQFAGVGEIEYAFRGLQNVAEYGPVSQTYWSMVFGLNSKTLYLKTFSHPAVIKSINLSQFDPSCSSKAQILDVDAAVSGDVTTSFHALTDADNKALIELNSQLSAPVKAALEAYPAAHTSCQDSL